MPEGVVDGGRIVDSGHESSPSGRSRKRPAGVPEAFVYDRKTREWRMPRRPGPKSDGDDLGEPQAGGGWTADRDPEPAHLGGHERDQEPGGGDDPGELDDKERDEIGGLLALIAPPIGAIAERRDPYCGVIFAQQLPEIVNAAVPIVAKSERVRAWLTAGTGGLMDWVGLAMALAPVGRAIAEHHVLKIVEILPEGQEPEPAAA